MNRPTTPVPTTITLADVLTVTVEPLDATRATVRLDGDVDLLCADGVAQVFTDQLSAGRRFVTVDVSRLTFVNSAGLQVFAQAHHHFLGVGGVLAFAGVGLRTAQLLAITGLDGALRVTDALAPDPIAASSEAALRR